MDATKRVLQVKNPLWLKFAAGIVALVLIVLTVNTLMVSLLVSGDVRVTAEVNNFSINQQRAQRVEETILNIINETRLYLSILSTLSMSGATQDQLSENFFRIHRDIAAIIIPNERRLVDTPFFTVNQIDPENLDLALLKMKSDIDRATYGETIMRNETLNFGAPMLALLLPVESGTSNAIIIFFSSELFNSDFGSGPSQSFMVNAAGELLAHGDPQIVRSGVVGESDVIQNIVLTTSENNFLSRQMVVQNDAGVRFFCAFRKLPLFDTVIITQIPYDLVFESVNATVLRNIYLAAIIMGLSISFAWFFSRYISKPIRILARASQDIEQGNYHLDIDFKRHDELGMLGATFVSMGQSLEKTHKELKDAYEQVRLINEGLENTVKERTAQLAEQTELALAASKAKTDFFAMMSHEIRTPMNAIMGMVGIMDTDNLDDKQLSYFRDIKIMSTALLNIINDILDISKIEAGKLDLIPVHYDIHALFDNIATISTFTSAGKQLELITHRDDTMPQYLYGDELRVRQVFTNIINNAVKYTPKGWVKVNLGLTNSGATNSGDHILFTVEDSGIGIKQEDIPKLFDSFQRLDSSKNRSIQGTGLGLSIIKRILDMMGGTVTVESEYEKGTKFIVEMPLALGDRAQVESSADSALFVTAKPGADIRILVVDDIDINRTVALGFLEKHKLSADTAANGFSAISMIEQKSKDGAGYDLVLMDHLMPDIDGMEASRRVRALGGLCEKVPIVALTANVVGDVKQMCLDAGMNDYISKPIVEVELNAILAKWLPQDKIELGKAAVHAAKKIREVPVIEDDDPLYGELAKIPGLDVEQGLAYVGNNRGIYYNVLKDYCGNVDERVTLIRQYFADKNWQQYEILVHGFKGILATFGAAAISAQAKELEFAAKDAAGTGAGDAGAQRGLMHRLLVSKDVTEGERICAEKTETVMEAFLAFRDRLLETSLFDEDKDKQQMSIQDIAGELRDLQEACNDFSSSDVARIADELEHISISPEIDAELADVLKLVNEIEYNEAAEKIGTILQRIPAAA